MKKRILASMALLVLAAAPLVFAEATPGAPAPSTMKYIAASMAVGLACIGSGIAVGQIGAAAMAAMSENPELSGRALPFLGLAEGICLWGFIVALMIVSAA